MGFLKLNDEEILGPGESGAFIASKARHLIQIDEEAIKNVSKMIFQDHLSGRLNESLFDSQELHVKNTDKEAIDWIFFIDVINFSFWGDNEESFTVSFRNSNGELAKQTGYFAACACVNKALESGIPLIKANYMASVTKNELAKIFKSDSGNIIPMLDQRVEVIHEAGKVLLELIVEECERLRNENSIDNSNLKPILATEVDMFLWVYRRRFANEIVKSNIPFHKVRCIYY